MMRLGPAACQSQSGSGILWFQLKNSIAAREGFLVIIVLNGDGGQHFHRLDMMRIDHQNATGDTGSIGIVTPLPGFLSHTVQIIGVINRE